VAVEAAGLVEALGARTQGRSALAVPSATIHRAVAKRLTAASMPANGADPHLGLVPPTSLAASVCAGTRRPQVQGPLALLALYKVLAAQAAAVLVANNAIPVARLVAQFQMGGL